MSTTNFEVSEFYEVGSLHNLPCSDDTADWKWKSERQKRIANSCLPPPITAPEATIALKM